MRDYSGVVARTIDQGIIKAGSASELARKIGATRQQVSRWRKLKKIKLENFLAVVEFINPPKTEEVKSENE